MEKSVECSCVCERQNNVIFGICRTTVVTRTAGPVAGKLRVLGSGQREWQKKLSRCCMQSITDTAVRDGVMVLALVQCNCRAFSSAAVHVPRSMWWYLVPATKQELKFLSNNETSSDWSPGDSSVKLLSVWVQSAWYSKTSGGSGHHTDTQCQCDIVLLRAFKANSVSGLVKFSSQSVHFDHLREIWTNNLERREVLYQKTSGARRHSCSLSAFPTTQQIYVTPSFLLDIPTPVTSLVVLNLDKIA